MLVRVNVEHASFSLPQKIYHKIIGSNVGVNDATKNVVVHFDTYKNLSKKLFAEINRSHCQNKLPKKTSPKKTYTADTLNVFGANLLKKLSVNSALVSLN